MTNINFGFIVNDNEHGVKKAFDREDYLQAFLLIHTLMESLLRAFLNVTDDNFKFQQLIRKYKEFLNEENPGDKNFVNELTEFNRRRNRIIHSLWKKGYTYTNRQAKDASFVAHLIYGLFIDYLTTYNENLEEHGFHYN